MDSKLELLLNKIQINKDYYKYFNLGKLVKIVGNKDKSKIRYIKNDTDYYNELKKIYTNHDDAEWEAYAGIVRKAVYSDTSATKEEAWYCMEMMNSVKDI